MRVLLDYVLVEQVAAGPLTVLHRARRLPGDESVAVKVPRGGLDADDRARADAALRAEGRALMLAGGPGVVPLVEVVDGSDGDRGPLVAVVTAWSAVGSLDRWLAADAHPSSRELVGLGGELTAALAGVAERGLLHRQPTLDHLLVGPSGELWLTGFAHAVATDDTAAALAAVRPVAEATLLALARYVPPARPSAPLPPWTPPAPPAPPAATVPRPLPRRTRSAPPPSGLAPAALGRGRGPGRRMPRVVAGVAAGLVAVIAVVAGTRALALGPGARPTLAPITRNSLPAPPSTRPACHRERLDAPAGSVIVTGHLDDDACPDEIRWWPALADAERRDGTGPLVRFHLGRPGDQLLLGDWDHDGHDTPGLYDPTTGEVDRFDAWAAPDRPLPGVVVTRAARRDGVARVARAAMGDSITVEVR